MYSSKTSNQWAWLKVTNYYIYYIYYIVTLTTVIFVRSILKPFTFC